MGLRLPVGDVTVLLGPAPARRRVMTALDESTGRCAGGHGGVAVHRLVAAPEDGMAERLAAVDAARDARATIVLVDRLTDGLAAGDRRVLLSALRPVATAGRAVLVDDSDPVAALAVADGALRAHAGGGLSPERVGQGLPDLPDYLAS